MKDTLIYMATASIVFCGLPAIETSNGRVIVI